MNNFRKNNLIFGWIAFAVAAVTYLLTIEPTTSLWDCPEFILCAFRLEVGHPPGNPFFLLLGRFFTLFTSDPTKVAALVNSMSALASAGTVLFLFWTISHFVRMIRRKTETEMDKNDTLMAMGCAMVGALVYTFSDTFWFSAVEGEVYALSSFFTAIAFWAILRWESADESRSPYANRWLILIAYLTGIGVGIHLLNLLIVPAIVFVWYFKKYPVVTKWGVTKAILASAAIVLFVMSFLMKVPLGIGARIDRMFVNNMGLPVNSGLLVFVFVLFSVLAWGIWYSYKKRKQILNFILTSTAVLLIGYSGYAVVVVRAAAHPPMNSNNPDNPYGLLGLLNRDQYGGSSPLLYGPAFNSRPVELEEKTKYSVDPESGKYVGAQVRNDYIFPSELKMLFPRMHSADSRHVEGYKSWSDFQGRPVYFGDEAVMMPTFGENMRYFVSYQINFMYWRYFMWNFAGRQSDIQGRGNVANGNWMSGIRAIDEIYLGPQDNLPTEVKNNRGRNHYYLLPFLLGIFGLAFQLKRDPKNFTVVMWFFFMTGLAIVIYLNQTTSPPRERDYAYAGSFYAFSIWAGLGVMCVARWVGKALKNRKAAILIASVACCGVPVLMAQQNWDDHDRSGRYVARDMGANYLNTTLKNSVLMNFGDNDTFPVWYSQDVEGVRLDVRVMNMSYISGDWYIDQMKQKCYDSEPLPLSLPRSKYLGSTNDQVLVDPKVNRPITAREAMDFVISDNPATKIRGYDYIPAKVLTVPVNKENVIASGIVREEDRDLILDTITLTIKDDVIYKPTLVLIDLLANFDWKRPLFFTSLGENLTDIGLDEYMQFDGACYRLVPIRTPARAGLVAGRIDTEVLYDNLFNKYRYGNVQDPKVYVDAFIHDTFEASRMRLAFGCLAMEYAAQGDTVKAVEVADRAREIIPFSKVRYDYGGSIALIHGYYSAGAYEKGNELLTAYGDNLVEYINFYSQLKGNKLYGVSRDISMDLTTLYNLYGIAAGFGQAEAARKYLPYISLLGEEPEPGPDEE